MMASSVLEIAASMIETQPGCSLVTTFSVMMSVPVASAATMVELLDPRPAELMEGLALLCLFMIEASHLTAINNVPISWSTRHLV